MLHFTSDAWDDEGERNLLPILASLNDTLLLDDLDVLPSLNTVYELTDRTNLRFAYSRTLARPTFRELAPYESFLFVGDYTLRGNPSLKRTLIDNFDLRYEMYPREDANELYSISVFYKRFTNAIEQSIIEEGSSLTRVITYQNISPAQVLGVELEARKNLDFISHILKNVNAGANFTYLYSRARLPDQEYNRRVENVQAIGLSSDVVDRNRRLFGQPKYIANAYMNYRSEDTKIDLSINFNMQGNFLSFVELDTYTPNIFTYPRPSLDVNFNYKFLKNFTLQVLAVNLLNPDYALRYDFEQYDDIYYERYKVGRTFRLGVVYKL
ncbi:MAG: TonB-dependent receptor [Bacteroidia bacterium]|nr:TonB-dependent receptor [Bacteroidia bacterium]